MLAAYHRAFAAELRVMVDTLPLAPGSVVLDMACGDGVYTPWLAERVGPDGRLFAFEPQPRIRAALEQSLALNNLTQAILLADAVSDREGETVMAMPEVTSSAVDTGPAPLGTPGAGEAGITVRSARGSEGAAAWAEPAPGGIAVLSVRVSEGTATAGLLAWGSGAAGFGFWADGTRPPRSGGRGCVWARDPEEEEKV